VKCIISFMVYIAKNLRVQKVIDATLEQAYELEQRKKEAEKNANNMELGIIYYSPKTGLSFIKEVIQKALIEPNQGITMEEIKKGLSENKLRAINIVNSKDIKEF